MLSRRRLLHGLSGAAAACILCPDALASSARALTLRELLLRSRHTLVGTPRAVESRWEYYAGARRIVTYTTLQVSQSIDGRPAPASELQLRTLGGSVGDIAQVVHGEAQPKLDRPGLLFLDSDEGGVFRVTGMAQGHYPLKPDANGVSRLIRSPNLAEMKDFTEAAVRVLPGRTVLEAEQLVVKALGDDSP